MSEIICDQCHITSEELDIENMFERGELARQSHFTQNREYKVLAHKYHKLVAFVRRVSSSSCCNVFRCRACDMMKLLREIGEEK